MIAFDSQYVDRWILGQAACKYGSCSSCADDDVVVSSDILEVFCGDNICCVRAWCCEKYCVWLAWSLTMIMIISTTVNVSGSQRSCFPHSLWQDC